MVRTEKGKEIGKINKDKRKTDIHHARVKKGCSGCSTCRNMNVKKCGGSYEKVEK